MIIRLILLHVLTDQFLQQQKGLKSPSKFSYVSFKKYFLKCPESNFQILMKVRENHLCIYEGLVDNAITEQETLYPEHYHAFSFYSVVVSIELN